MLLAGGSWLFRSDLFNLKMWNLGDRNGARKTVCKNSKIRVESAMVLHKLGKWKFFCILDLINSKVLYDENGYMWNVWG